MGALTLSGNEVTDAVRLAGLEGDGRPIQTANFLADAMGHNSGAPFPWAAWEGAGAGQAARVTTPVINPRGDSTRCYEHSIQSGDTFGGGDRSEFRDAVPGLREVEGAEWWYGDTVQFPSGQVRPSGWAIFDQFHCQDVAFGQSAFKFQWDVAGVDPKGVLLPERASLVLTTGPFANAGEAGSPPEAANFRYTLWPWEFDAFFEWRMFVKWSITTRGIVRVWWRRWDPVTKQPGPWVLAVDRSGANTIPLRLDTGLGTGINLKAGFYRNTQAITNTVRHYRTVAAQSWGECEHDYAPSARDGSLGIGPAVTNLCPNPSVEVDTTGLVTNLGTEGITRVTSAKKFGDAAVRVSMPGGASSESMRYRPNLTNGERYTAQAFLKAESVEGERQRLYSLDSAAAQLATQTVSAKVIDWLWLFNTFIANANNPHQIRHGRTASGAVQTLLGDGFQLEVGNVPTPLTLTSRGASKVTGAAALLSPRRGCIALWIRPWWPNTQPPGVGTGQPRAWSWQLDANNLLRILFDEATNSWKFDRLKAGAGAGVTIADTFQRYERILLLAGWTEDQIALSLNGDAWVFAANSSIPDLSTVEFAIGSDLTPANHIYADLLSVCGGLGFPDAAARAFLKGLDGASVYVEQLPDVMQATFSAPAESSSYDEDSAAGIETASTWGNLMRDFMDKPSGDGISVGRPRVL